MSDEVFQRVERRTMANHEHRPARECRRGLGEPRGHTSHDLLITLTVGERRRDMKDALLLNLQRGLPRESPVIAFTEPGITDNWESATAEGDLGGTKGACQVRTEHRCEVIVATTRSKQARLVFASY